jgi:hypothetical protein
MKTIKITTKSTTTFSWAGSTSRGVRRCEVEGLREAVVAAVDDLRSYARGDGAAEGIRACVVEWEDGDVLRAFVHVLDIEVPAALPWTLMQTRPDRSLREAL